MWWIEEQVLGKVKQMENVELQTVHIWKMNPKKLIYVFWEPEVI
jgi:hypothetical protein